MVYNLTFVTNSTGILQFTQRVNSELMAGWLGTLIIIIIFSILLISILARSNNARQAFAAASFICFGLSMFLRALDLVPNLAIFAFLMMAAFGVAILKTT